ncbi:MAG: allantoicase [Actinobacteria bacterium]|nr:allantoicase [Actinomycetota bacterium]
MTGALVNLASRVLGAGVVAASDDAFGAKESLVVDGDPDTTTGRFSLVGEVVDGWETRRRRTPGHDWAIVRLGAPGVVRRVVVDTRGFTGNFPARYAVDACALAGHPDPADLLDGATTWHPLVPLTALASSGAATHDVDGAAAATRWTHVRLRQEPDGGIARLRVLGSPVPDPAWFDDVTVDLLAQGLGSLVTSWSDAFYTHPEVLTRPDLPRTMGEGWEARRRRDDGHDWAVVRLAAAATPRVLEVDTSYYVYNASSHVTAWGATSGDVGAEQAPAVDDDVWFPLLPRTALQPDTRHRFALDPLPRNRSDVAWLRLDVFPDAGLSRVRLHGVPTSAGRAALRRAWERARPPQPGGIALR